MKKKIISFITEITLTTLVFVLLFFYFYNLDKGFMLENNYFPWDSHGYYEVAKNFSLSKPMPVFENPFGERIIFPILFFQIAKILNLELRVCGLPFIIVLYAVALVSRNRLFR